MDNKEKLLWLSLAFRSEKEAGRFVVKMNLTQGEDENQPIICDETIVVKNSDNSVSHPNDFDSTVFDAQASAICKLFGLDYETEVLNGLKQLEETGAHVWSTVRYLSVKKVSM